MVICLSTEFVLSYTVRVFICLYPDLFPPLGVAAAAPVVVVSSNELDKTVSTITTITITTSTSIRNATGTVNV